MVASRVVAALVVLVGASTGLTGCGGSEDRAGSSGASGLSSAADGAASVAPSDVGDATSGDTDLDGEADAGAAMTPGELCGFLDGEKPKVVDLQPAEYAAATFGSALFAFYTDHGLLTDIDGSDLDTLVATGCPGTAAQLLSHLGATSFAELLSR